jgi:large subunit ribosomal protein L10
VNKDEKTTVVAELTDELKGADAIFAIDYRGISVPQAAELREGLRDADTRFRVVKNRLTLRAADAAGTETIKEHLEGPTALALVKGDAALAAKTIFRLGSEWEVLDYKGGIMDGEALDGDTFEAIARLPGREAMNAQAAGIIASPLTGLVRGLGSMVQGLALQLGQIAEQGLVTGEEETPGEEEAPAAEEETKPDPEPSGSPEEQSAEQAPESEEAGEESQVEETTEGDAEIGEAQEGSEEGGEEETSDDSDEAKEDGE